MKLLLTLGVVLASGTQLDPLYQSYVDAPVDTTRSAEMLGVKLFEDDIRITFIEGTLYPLEAVGGVDHGAVFIGRGQFVFVPPSDVEEAALVRALDRRAILNAESSLDVRVLEDGSIDVRVRDYASEILIDRPFEVAVLRFSPDFAEELGIEWKNEPGPDVERAQRVYEKRHKLHRRTIDKGFDSFDIDLHTMSAALPSDDPPSFLLFETRPQAFTVKYFGTERSDPWLSYWRSDDEGEEHELYVIEPRTSVRSNLEALSSSGAVVGPTSPDVVDPNPQIGGGGADARGSQDVTEALDGPVFTQKGIASNTLSFRPRRPNRSPGLTKTIIASFHDKTERQQYDPLLLASEAHPRIDVEDIELDLEVKKGGRKISAEAVVRFRTVVDHTQWIALELASAQPHPSNAATFGRITVESVTDLGGTPLDFVHKGGGLVVQLAEPRVAGQRGAVKVTYGGDVVWPDEVTTMMDVLPEGEAGNVPFRNRGLDFLPQSGTSYSPLAGFAFYPRGLADRSRVELTVCTPQHARVVATGRQVETWRNKDEKQRCSRHIENLPVRDVAVLFGAYQCEEKRNKDLPTIRACSFPRQASTLPGLIREAEGLLRVYEVLFGNYPFDEIDITQTGFDSQFTGSAAGVIFMDGAQFLSKATLANELSPDQQPDMSITFNMREVTENVRIDINQRHERLAQLAARQWWGEKVGPRTEHDVWLMEAAVAYGTALYMAKLREPAAFDQAHNRWMQDSLRWEVAGPLWLGPSRLDEVSALAAKGPVVLHMLRDQMGTDAFFGCLRTLGDLSGGRDVSTEELQIVCEKVHGQRLQWFFDAWVRGGTLPEIQYAYTVSQNPEKKSTWDIRGEVQLGEEFLHAVRIPIVLDYGKKKTERVHLLVNPNDGSFSITGLPVKPVKLKVDDEILLARKIRKRGEL